MKKKERCGNAELLELLALHPKDAACPAPDLRLRQIAVATPTEGLDPLKHMAWQALCWPGARTWAFLAFIYFQMKWWEKSFVALVRALEWLAGSTFRGVACDDGFRVPTVWEGWKSQGDVICFAQVPPRPPRDGRPEGGARD